MEADILPLVLTKLRAPALRRRQISRPRLVKLLSSENAAGLVLVCAPAGYGKTSLLSEWVHSLLVGDVTVAWYALDPGDDDPVTFGSYLVAALLKALGPLPDLAQTARLLRTSTEIDLQRILPVIVNSIAASSRECILILDDYHLIDSPAVHNVLVYLLEHRPENLRIALGSRADPPLPLARLRARGQLLEIRAADLRFTDYEAAQFLNEGMHLELSPQGIATLGELTEGWAAGLQLAALSSAGRADKEEYLAAFSGSHRYLVEYLMEEVVSRQPEAVQSFLLASSILERLCAPLCDCLFEEKGASSHSQAYLEELERTNLFLVSLDDEGIWYRYHHLFRDFLQARLIKTQPERVEVLHGAASAWLGSHGYLREAARHIFQAKDWEAAASFIEQHSFDLIVHSEITTIYEWCSALPEEIMQAHPMLCILQGMALAYGFRRQNRARVEARLDQAGLSIQSLEDKDAARGLIDMAGVVRTFLAMAPDPAADPQVQLALAQEMLDAYPQGDPARFSGLLLTGYAYLAQLNVRAAGQAFETARQIALIERLYFGIVEAAFHLARLAHTQGQLRRAVEICQQAQADLESLLEQPEQALPAIGCLDVALGCILLEQDQLEEAGERLHQGLNRMGSGMNPYYLLVAYTGIFRLCQVQGQTAEALNSLDRLEAAWPDVAFYTDGLRVMQGLHNSSNDPKQAAEAERWSTRFSAVVGGELPSAGIGPFGAAEAYYLASLSWIRVQIATGQARSAQPYLVQQIDLATTHGLSHRVIELSVLEALAAQAEGEIERTRTALDRALSLAQPEGYLRSFDQVPALALLLDDAKLRAEAAGHHTMKEYIGRILAVIGQPEASDGDQQSSVRIPYGESLSERELQVLHWMAKGATNQEIAERLVITVGTVKSHINHILAKLGARNRTEAVALARSLNLLQI